MLPQAAGLKNQLAQSAENLNGLNLVAAKIDLNDSKAAKTLAFQLETVHR